jgi:hypothetical protein
MEFMVLGLVSLGVWEFDINVKVHSLDILLYTSLNTRLQALDIQVNHPVFLKPFSTSQTWANELWSRLSGCRES